MERFLSLVDPRDEVQRRIILKLLAEEEATLREGALEIEAPRHAA